MTDAISVVRLTAHASPADQAVGLDTGAEVYPTKPVDQAVLDACVSALLTPRRPLRDQSAEAGPVAARGSGSGTAASGTEHADPSGVAGPTSPRPAAVERLVALAAERLTDPALDPKTLAAVAGLSYHQLYRALRHAGEGSPSRFIRRARVEQAAELLRRRIGSVTEVAYAVGFESLSYFSRAFRERFGAAPSAFLRGADGTGAATQPVQRRRGAQVGA